MKTVLSALILTLLAASAAPARADAPAAKGVPAAAPTTQPVATEAATEPGTGTPTAEEVIQELMRKRQQSPAIEPVQRLVPAHVPGRRASNPLVLGTAPHERPGRLLREGQFIVDRRGRVVPAADGSHFLFLFDGDGAKSPETPMILAPCEKSQSMEEMAHQLGDRAVFIVTGQILTYRGANYLLPTIAKEAVDHGNLEH